MQCPIGVGHRSYLQYLWDVDQQQAGVMPLLPSDDRPLNRSFLIVDEAAIQGGSSNSPRSVQGLFPGGINWLPDGPPVTYQVFDRLVEAASRYTASEPNSNTVAEFTTRINEFMGLVLQSEALSIARQLLRQYGGRNLQDMVSDDNRWMQYLRQYWFCWPECLGRPGRVRAELPSIRALIESFRDRQKSAADTKDIVFSLISMAPSEMKTLTLPSGGASSPDFISSLFDIPADQASLQLSEIQKCISINKDAIQYTTLLSALVDDLILLYRLSGRGSWMPFAHLMIGDYGLGSRTLGGYHFWYKAFTDSRHIVTPGRFESHGLAYNSSFRSKGPQIPEVVSLELSMQLVRSSNGEVLLDLKKQKCGFLVGCSPEGLMALCMVAHLLGSRRAGSFSFRDASVGLYTSSQGNRLITAYPDV